MLSLYALILSTLLTLSLADVRFLSPAAGEILPGGRIMTVEWEESGDGPAISTLQNYELFLCAGGNGYEEFVQLTALVTQATFASGNSASGQIPVGIGASTPRNIYFLKMVSAAKQGGFIVNYSPRFTLTGMTGTFPAKILDTFAKVSGLEGPPSEDKVANDVGADGFLVPFAEQEGPTRYAPMQPVPPTKITAKSRTPLYPPSSVVLATTFLPPPVALTTVTASQTFKVESRENPAEPAPHPTDDMERFLNRWKD